MCSAASDLFPPSFKGRPPGRLFTVVQSVFLFGLIFVLLLVFLQLLVMLLVMNLNTLYFVIIL